MPDGRSLHLFRESSPPPARCVPPPNAWPIRRAIDRLVLSAFTYKGEGSPTLAKRAEALDYSRSHNPPPARSRNMIRSIFTRRQALNSDPAIGDFSPTTELKFCDQVPTRPTIRQDGPICPSSNPLTGSLAGAGCACDMRLASVDDLSAVLQALAERDRQFVILPRPPIPSCSCSTGKSSAHHAGIVSRSHHAGAFGGVTSPETASSHSPSDEIVKESHVVALAERSDDRR